MEERKVVTVFLFREGKVLVLRRSGSVGTYQGKWAGVSGFLEDDSPLEQAFTEVAEETGLARGELTLLSAGLPMTVPDRPLGVRWLVHPFLFRVETPEKLKLDWEHTEHRWVGPEEVGALDSVPMLFEVLRKVYPV